MKRKKIVILPKLNDAGGNLSKKWFVYYSVRDPRTDKMERFKDHVGLSHPDESVRRERADKIIQELTVKLKKGWTPFLDDTEAIYEDQLQYKHVADIYGTQKAANATFRMFASQYIEEKKKEKLEEKTIQTYVSKLRMLTVWSEANKGQIDITAFDNALILEFFNYLVNKKKLATGTINDYRQIISSAFDFIKDQGKISENPVYNIPSGVDKDMAPRPVAEWDIEIFREAITKNDPQLWMAIEFETYCFLRPGKELRLLKIGDIDFARGLINVDRFRAKTNRERYATIPRHFMLKLRNIYQLQKYNRDYYVFGKEYKPGLTPLGKNNLKNRFNGFRTRLNMPDSYKLYSWKHTGNSLAADSDINMLALRDQNGHTSVQTTEIYLKHKLGVVNKEIQNKFPCLDTL